MSHMVQRLGFLVFTQVARVQLPVWEQDIYQYSLVCQKYFKNDIVQYLENMQKKQQLTCPIWSSGQESWFSPRWPGFDSRYGNRIFMSIVQFVENMQNTTQYSISKICKKTAINMSHMVQRLGFLVLTQVARVKLPVWEQDIYQYSLVCLKYGKNDIVQFLKNMQKYNN